MKIEIHFVGNDMTFEHIANVDAPEHYDVERALEYAWGRVQNCEGSWSQGEVVNGVDNPDYDPNIEVLVPLMEYDGHRYGFRSAMVGDRFVIDGKVYEVSSFGFDKISEV